MPSRPQRAGRALVLVALFAASAPAFAQSAPQGAAARPSASLRAGLTSPREEFGHDIGADYVLPNYSAFMRYWQKLAGQSDRMELDTIGPTAEGRAQLMAIVSSPANLRDLERYKSIARRLALAEGVDSAEARRLAREGKAVVWIDGGLHATETLGAQQLLETVWQLVSRDDEETRRFLDDVIVLAVHANPDGMELVSDWYMRTPEPTKRSLSGVPRLYQKYIGHDNNRDFYAVTQPESENIARVQYREWFPQIVYNHHQTGPAGTILFAPPFRDPFNYFYDPLVVTGIDLVGAAMHNRFVVEDKPGATTRRGANYSTWWNGGLRTTVYFHNMIGLLTETIGSPTPMEVPFLPNRQLASGDLVMPVPPQRWHFRQSVDYSVTANRAVLDVASRHREQFLFNIWKMGANSIERGSRDHWTITPSEIDSVRAVAQREGRGGGGGARPDAEMGGGTRTQGLPMEYWNRLRAPERRDPRAYVIPRDEGDFLTATRFVQALQKTGVVVHRAAAPFSSGGRTYPAGSYVVLAAQAFRPHVLDMFEPQDHPNDFQYPGGPPIPPYDNAGYTLAYQMGVRFDRLLDAPQGRFERIDGLATPPAGRVAAPPTRGRARGWFLAGTTNDAFVAVNRLLKAGQPVYRLAEAGGADNRKRPAGTFYIPASAASQTIIERAARENGLDFEGAAGRPSGVATRLALPRIGLWDRYGGSMPSGWVRWILERYEFPYEVVYAPQLDAGNLAQRYDVLVFLENAIPRRDRAAGDSTPQFFGGQPRPEDVPAEYRARLGTVTVANTVPRLREFLEAGGTVVTVGNSTNLAYHLGLPVASALEENGRPLSREKFFVPGSVLMARVDNTRPATFGMADSAHVFFDESPAFRLADDAEAKGVRRLMWYDGAAPLRSGWAWGQRYLAGATAAAEARVGRGTLLLFGPEITFRAQPHGTFKLLFNSLYLGQGAVRPLR